MKKKNCFKGKYGLYNDSNGRMMFQGKPFMGIGVNYFDLFTSAFYREWDIRPSLRAMEVLKKYGCKVIRFSTLPFYVEEYIYYEQTDLYWMTMDAVVSKAEELGIGLLPSLFWTYSVNDYCDEPYQSAYLDENSKTVAFIKDYIHKFVGRYVDSPAIYGWEFSNERVLGSDWPDASHFRGVWNKSNRKSRDERDRVTLDGLNAMYSLFANCVAGEDPYERIISTGDTNPRETSYNRYAYGDMETKDTHEQHEKVLDLLNPKGITALSQHQYSYGLVIDPKDATSPLLDYFNTWHSFFSYLIEMSSKRNMSAYAGEVGYAHRYPENYGKITLENATRPFYEAVVAQRQTGLPLILFWNYDPTAVQSNAAYIYDRGTGIEYSFSEHSSRGKRILEIMKEGNQILNEMNK